MAFGFNPIWGLHHPLVIPKDPIMPLRIMDGRTTGEAGAPTRETRSEMGV